ncbi:MAG: TonB-dependent receptor [Pseudomonadales bacterium]
MIQYLGVSRVVGLCMVLMLAGASSSRAAVERVQEQPKVYVDTGSGTLADALITVAHQADLSIIFGTQEAFETPVASVRGYYPIAEVLQQLLAESELEPVFVSAGVIAIRPIECANDPNCEDIVEAIDQGALEGYPRLEEMTIIGRTITGSRIRRNDYDGSAPVDIISAADLELAGAQSIGDFLKFLPSVVGNSTSTSISNGGDGSASVTLRGLPASNTLVLINGRRVANNGLAGESVDLNAIAPSAIAKIEVLKSGASAVYGSDAIAGVINIILKKDFDGLQVDTYYGSSVEGDLGTRNSSFTFGHTFERGDLIVSGTHYDQDALFSRDRSVSSSADTRRFGGADRRSSATPNARINLPTGVVVPEVSVDGPLSSPLSAEDFRLATDDDLFNFREFTTATVPSERSSLYAHLQFDVTDQTSTYLDYDYITTEAESRLAPTPVFTAFETIDLPVAASNIYNPFGIELIDVRKRVLELGARAQENESKVRRLAWGLESQHDNYAWDVGFHWSKTDATETLHNLIDASRLQRALGDAAQCLGIAVDGCEPFNLFGPPGVITPSQLDYVAHDAKVRGYSKLYGITLNSSATLATLPAGPLEIAMGYEYRKESTAKKPVTPDILTLGGANFDATSGGRRVHEMYFETLVPLLRKQPGVHSLELDLAARYSHYNDFGDTSNPRIAVKYRPIAPLLLRASYAEGFRAPSLLELNQISSQSQDMLQDPCADSANVGVLMGCVSQSDNTRVQFLTLNGGNQDLLPEDSEYSSYGFVWSSSRWQGFTASLDYYNISQRNVVNADAQFILDQNAATGAFSDRVERDAAGELQKITATNINIGERKVSGWDIAMNYNFPRTRYGRYFLSFNAANIHQYQEQPFPDAQRRNLEGQFVDEASEGRGALPKWKYNLGMYWKHKQWQANYTLHYISALDEEIPGLADRRTIDRSKTHDVQLSYLFLIANGLRVTFGIDNLFDENPPFAASAFNDNIDSRTHELTGRFWYARLAQRF